jgi:undecaprenyl-diphosphatase
MIFIQALDKQLLLFVNHSLSNPAFDVLMPALTRRGYLLVIPFLLAMFLRAASRKDKLGKPYLSSAIWTFLIACCAVYLSVLVEDWMKDAVARVRPCRAMDGLRLILPCPTSFSMPSGHALSSFAFAAPIWCLTAEYVEMIWRLYPLALAALIAFSRIYLGVHYPTDVLVGAFLGGSIGMGLSILYQAIATEEFIKRRMR